MKWTIEEDAILLNQYGKITSSQMINDKLLNRTQLAICSRANLLGLSSKLQGNINKKYYYNEHYFNIPTIENCYWAGFIAADGNLSKKNGLRIGLAKKDKCLLEKLSDDLCYNGEIKSYRDGIVNLNIYGGQICRDLYLNFGLTENKTFHIKPPKLCDINLILAFIRGYIDGDGCVRRQKNGLLVIEITSSSKNILEWIKNIFDDLSLPTKGRSANVRKYKNKNCFRYAVGGVRAEIIGNILKTSLTYNLARKWDRVNN